MSVLKTFRVTTGMILGPGGSFGPGDLFTIEGVFVDDRTPWQKLHDRNRAFVANLWDNYRYQNLHDEEEW